MSILIGNYEFDGPYQSAVELEEKPGLVAILHCEDEKYELIHLAESDNVKDRLQLSSPTNPSPTGSLVIIALYTPAATRGERKTMIADIESEFEDDCDSDKSAELHIDFDIERFDLVAAAS